MPCESHVSSWKVRIQGLVHTDTGHVHNARFVEAARNVCCVQYKGEMEYTTKQPELRHLAALHSKARGLTNVTYPDPKYIIPGGEVPIQLYLKNCPKVSADPDAIPCCLAPGQKLEIPVTVEGAGSTLCWKFQTIQGHDVGFGVAHKPKGIAKTKEVLQLSRVKCDLVPQTGQLHSEPGTYTFTFDNGYSWFTKKHLFYVLEVKDYEGLLSPAS